MADARLVKASLLSCALVTSTVQLIEIEDVEMSKIETLTPEDSAIALIDYQPAMYQGVQSHDRLVGFNNI